MAASSGGGIGGLTLAVALSRYPDIQVDVYEAAGQFKEIGAGVMIWARTWEILSFLGMAEDFSRIAHAPPDGSPGAYCRASRTHKACIQCEVFFVDRYRVRLSPLRPTNGGLTVLSVRSSL